MAGTKPSSPNKTQQAKKQNKEHVYQPHWKSTFHAQVKLKPNYSCNLKNRQKKLKIENKNWQVWEERHKFGIWDEHIYTRSPVWFSVTPRPGAPQDPPSRGLPRQEYWSGLPFSTPSYLPSQPRDRTDGSCISCIGRRHLGSPTCTPCSI